MYVYGIPIFPDGGKKTLWNIILLNTTKPKLNTTILTTKKLVVDNVDVSFSMDLALFRDSLLV